MGDERRKRRRKGNFKYICPYPASTCPKSYNSKRCCYECNVSQGCKSMCFNSPDKCGAEVIE